MKTFRIWYYGNNHIKKFLGSIEVNANTEREAVLDFYQSRFPENYFPGRHGEIKDQDGDTICLSYDDRIFYDGGYFYAEALPDVAWWDRDKVLIVENVSSREDLISAVNGFLDDHPGSAAVFTKAAPDDNGAWFVPVLWA